jgi:hypothetical protein
MPQCIYKLSRSLEKKYFLFLWIYGKLYHIFVFDCNPQNELENIFFFFFFFGFLAHTENH